MSVVIVTGASRGIGEAIVKHVLRASEENKVVVTSRTLSKMVEIYSGFNQNNIEYVGGDISDGKTIDEIIERSVDKFGRIDSIVVNAGILEPVDKISNYKNEKKEWERLFQVNFFSAIELVSKSIEYLRKSHGRIIFTSSGASVKNTEGWGAYGASKAALNHLCGTISNEEKANGIRTISVAPGVVDTQMQDDIRGRLGEKGMSLKDLKIFQELKKDGKLLDPKVPGKVLGNLALMGIEEELNGVYLRYNDKKLAKYK
ncbi:NAD(P)-binding protein [Ascoidea rubescens DSM 1968]|uniref:NAD(P)-binding protein n=1 Tax=Ascoidea rubescens DSM 1968 TaxID=1344418 RepID=A0A1D2VCD2_9ASCO|nr:NAD(P)-binding protein [Ascoidea rubescens DSM 1968]ODV59147.1 NAD(P)-binding protein [Ascoidea rubescens DSM 1968]